MHDVRVAPYVVGPLLLVQFDLVSPTVFVTNESCDDSRSCASGTFVTINALKKSAVCRCVRLFFTKRIMSCVYVCVSVCECGPN